MICCTQSNGSRVGKGFGFSLILIDIQINGFNANRPLDVVYIQVAEEHPDNQRFLQDCESWFGQSIQILGNEDYQHSIFSVFEQTKYLVGPAGAACTRLLKKKVRMDFEQPGDRQVFGYTFEEEKPVKNTQQYEVVQGQKIARSLTIKSVKSNKIIIQSSDGMIADGENWESPTKTRFELPVGKKLKLATKIYDAGCEYTLELIPKPSK